MGSKLFVVFLAAVCLTEVVKCELTPEAEYAQYAVVKYASEATIFRMRAYSVALEMNYSVKKIDQQIIAKMVELTLEATVIDDLKTVLTDKAVLINDNIMKIMTGTDALIAVLEATNNNIANNPTELNVDLVKINAETNNVNLIYDLGSSNIQGSIDYVKLKIELALATVPVDDPLKLEIQGLIVEAETILQVEHDAMAASKVVFDAASATATAALEALIATPPPPPNGVVPAMLSKFRFNINPQFYPSNFANIMTPIKANKDSVSYKYHPRNIKTLQQ